MNIKKLFCLVFIFGVFSSLVFSNSENDAADTEENENKCEVEIKDPYDWGYTIGTFYPFMAECKDRADNSSKTAGNYHGFLISWSGGLGEVLDRRGLLKIGLGLEGVFTNQKFNCLIYPFVNLRLPICFTKNSKHFVIAPFIRGSAGTNFTTCYFDLGGGIDFTWNSFGFGAMYRWQNIRPITKEYDKYTFQKVDVYFIFGF